jgi:hypothetical protein
MTLQIMYSNYRRCLHEIDAGGWKDMKGVLAPAILAAATRSYVYKDPMIAASYL